MAPRVRETGEAESVFINPLPTPVDVGGIPAGSSFPYPGLTMEEIFNLLLYPYIQPTFSSFLLDVLVLEVGAIITGNHTFTWTETTVGNIKPNTLDLLDVTGSVVLEVDINIASPKVHDFTSAPIQKLVEANNVFRVRADNTQIPTVPFTRDYTVYWKWMVYAGATLTTPLVETDIEALTDYAALSTGFARTYAFSAGGYKYICYPASMGTATVFKDTSTNLDVPMEAPYIVNVTNAHGVATNYRVHRTTNVLGSAINIAVS